MGKKVRTRKAYRSAITGRFIKAGTAKRYPKTSIKQTITVLPKKRKRNG